jgi:pimeloyl-CoA synthetase
MKIQELFENKFEDIPLETLEDQYQQISNQVDALLLKRNLTTDENKRQIINLKINKLQKESQKLYNIIILQKEVQKLRDAMNNPT